MCPFNAVLLAELSVYSTSYCLLFLSAFQQLDMSNICKCMVYVFYIITTEQVAMNSPVILFKMSI